MKVQNIHIKCTEHFKEQLKQIAEENGLSVSAYMTQLATKEINKNKGVARLKGKKSFEEMVNELVEIETDAGCHTDEVEDYTSEKAYYLSNVIEDSYINYVIESMGVDEKTAIDLQCEVISIIKSKY